MRSLTRHQNCFDRQTRATTSRADPSIRAFDLADYWRADRTICGDAGRRLITTRATKPTVDGDLARDRSVAEDVLLVLRVHRPASSGRQHFRP
jgi:hypothetical protein